MAETAILSGGEASRSSTDGHPYATLDDVVEVLQGIGRLLMKISANLQTIVDMIEGDDEEANS